MICSKVPATRIRIGWWAAVAAALLLGGCGGSARARKSSTGDPAAAIGAPSRAKTQPGLLGGSASAGAAAGYKPTGPIVADDGFRPQLDGFAFENYGNDAGPVNLTAANVQDIFGPAVCASGAGASCRLIPQAAMWMTRVNASMANGHCMGFSVTALRFFAHQIAPDSYGARTTIGLQIRGNDPLQSLIAEDFAYQDLPSVTSRAVFGTPDHVLAVLIGALRGGRQLYTLGILKADGSGGHAITPFAVEDRGNGKMAILVYDNNFPGVVRKVDVDTRADTWHYLGGVNPSDTGEIYAGDAKTQSMGLFPTTPGEGTQPCPFCAAKGQLPGKPTVLDRLHYVEVAVTAKGNDHPHLLFIDPQGRRTGYLGGKLVNEIPGMQVISDYSVQNWRAAPEPVYHLPLDHPTLRVLIDGSGLQHPAITQLQVNGAGLVFYVQDIHVVPGQQDAMVLPAGDLAIAYVPGGRFPASPTLGVQFPQLIPGTDQGRLITIATGWLDFKPGSPVTLAILPRTGTAEVSLAGARPLIAQTRVVLSTDSTPVGRGGNPEHSYLTYALPLNGTSAQSATFQYLNPTGNKLPVRLDDGRS
jgi:hypothetical protein